MTDEIPSPYVVNVNATSYDLWKNRTPLLGSLDLELTERCNNDCIHCCINLPEEDAAREREIPTGEVKRILTEAATLGALSVRFTGGAPPAEGFCGTIPVCPETWPECYDFHERPAHHPGNSRPTRPCSPLGVDGGHGLWYDKNVL